MARKRRATAAVIAAAAAATASAASSSSNASGPSPPPSLRRRRRRRRPARRVKGGAPAAHGSADASDGDASDGDSDDGGDGSDEDSPWESDDEAVGAPGFFGAAADVELLASSDEEAPAGRARRRAAGARGGPPPESGSSSEEERNPVGSIPMRWYDGFDHIGYGRDGTRLARGPRTSLVERAGDPRSWRTVYDEKNGVELTLTGTELAAIARLRAGRHMAGAGAPGTGEVVAWAGDVETLHPLTAGTVPKRRFLPSKHEARRVVQLVRAMRAGLIPTSRKPLVAGEAEAAAALAAAAYEVDLWGAPADGDGADEDNGYGVGGGATDRPSRAARDRAGAALAAPKVPLPGHAASYRPPPEYLPSAKEAAAWAAADPADRRVAVLPTAHDALRHVPLYAAGIKERFNRCLDLYLAVRVRARPAVADVAGLVPALPSPRELRPYPNGGVATFGGGGGGGACAPCTCTRGGGGSRRGGTTGACGCGRWRRGAAAPCMRLGGGGGGCRPRPRGSRRRRRRRRWRRRGGGDGRWHPPVPHCGRAVVPPGRRRRLCRRRRPPHRCRVGGGGARPLPRRRRGRLCTRCRRCRRGCHRRGGGGAGGPRPRPGGGGGGGGRRAPPPTSAAMTLTWADAPVRVGGTSRPTPPSPALTIASGRPLRALTWHRHGDYLGSLASDASGTTLAIHRLSRRASQTPLRRRTSGLTTLAFHPCRPLLLVGTQHQVRVYHLGRGVLVKRLQPGVKHIACLAVHPSGDHVLVGSYDRRTVWVDLDLSPRPYKVLRGHPMAVRSLAIHPTLPLFADGGDEGGVHVWHGRVFDDLDKNPLIVPLKRMRGHTTAASLGVMDLAWHPRLPWLFSAGADGAIRMYADVE
ncbi:hypothetical protein BU14_0293s0019 [Porphyra umbilicalis]|uniref:BOP1 N-terminal domain-containing protein n=1 Tax=Porphyra umbilicalis TaxID=2786 RepID=A0A1X6P0G1_PORUM|nr:hypothetical protein BU14_0293s0019 [Porphyra umbilicalis]|eukprot:OSX74348.1 hypothetical protein BU14_0293s0019 [Porphyra umbilicalis]